jgi:hypothetical protein
MNNSNVPISGVCPNESDPSWAAARINGLTKRQQRALTRNQAAMGGLGGGNIQTALQEQAVTVADALLKELEK